MPIRNYTLRCSVCEKKVGVISIVYFRNIPHAIPACCCMGCLPDRVRLLEKGYDRAALKKVKAFLKEEE